MPRPFKFDAEKGLEVLLYIACNYQQDFYYLLKVLYFADRLHLERYGRPVCGDHYIAMQSGVVPSGLYDLVKDVREEREPSYEVDPQAAFDLHGYRIVPKRDVKLDLLSASDLECLNEAITEVKRMDWATFKARTHGEDYKAASPDDEIPFEALAATLPSGDLLIKAIRS